MACDKQPSFGSLLEQLIVAPYAMRIDLGKRVLERVVAQVAELTRERDIAEIHERELRALQLEHESEVARLQTALAAANTECDSRAVAMRELREALAEANKAALYSAQREQAAESRLAAANALLVRVLKGSLGKLPEVVRCEIHAHLAAQPATAPARTRAEEAAEKRRERSLKGAATRRANAAVYSPENEDAMTYGVGEPATAPARDEAEPPCVGCRDGTQDHHTCQRAIIPPQTWVPPSGRPPRG